MSLVGNLEDLGLGDILQIVSLSRKSGILFISSDEKEGKFIFRDGQVIRAFSSDVKEDMQGALAASGLLDDVKLKEATDIYEGKGKSESIDSILIGQFGVSKDELDLVKKECVEKSAYSLFVWERGTFNFDLKDVGDFIDVKTDFFIYDHGVNPQFLAMEGTRLQDEMRRDQKEREAAGEALAEEAPPVQLPEEAAPPAGIAAEETTAETAVAEEAVAEEAVAEEAVAEETPAAEPSVESAKKAVVIIDDDAKTLEVINDGLKTRGFSTFSEEKTESALHTINRLKSAGASVAAISDLIMPRMDGTGILGGIELLEIMKGGFPDVPVLLMTDHTNNEAEERAKQIGVHAYIDKPKKAQFSEETGGVAVGNFLDGLKEMLNPIFGQGAAKVEGGKLKVSDMFNIADDLREEVEAVGSILPEEGTQPVVVTTPGLTMLKSMIEELTSPEGGKQITLLTLRFASELMNRAVIFMVKNDAFEGLGQFGVEIEGEVADKRIRAMRISKDEPSILKDVLDSGMSVKKRMEDSEANRYIVEQFGGVSPFESYAAPIITEGRMVVIVYGDNLPEEKEVGDTAALEIFLMQAGVAMERALLERKVKEISEH